MEHLHFSAVYPYLGTLPKAIWTSISLTMLAVLIGLPVGLWGALLSGHRMRAVRWPTAAYVELMRNTPVIVLLFLIFFGLPQTGIKIGGYGAALISLTLNGSAYMIEIFRGGLTAIPDGQYEAAMSLGLGKWTMFRLIVFPQLIRIAYAPLGNVFIQILLGSSLASVVSVAEVSDWMQNTGSQTFRFFETFAIAGVVYIVMCQIINVGRILTGRLLFRSWG
jgi:His/Glu/Gln/Arg/opine family amino acid ABC transporter permease subunit